MASDSARPSRPFVAADRHSAVGTANRLVTVVIEVADLVNTVLGPRLGEPALDTETSTATSSS